MSEENKALTKMREPFHAGQVSKLPKETRAQIDARKTDRSVLVWKCGLCGGTHHKDAVHLDYVGHAAITDRLLDADITWSWEPMAFDERGLPARDQIGGMWINLTVGGITRPGYGAADGKTGGDAIKEIIGDALRNASMRFGAGLELWHKGDLHGSDSDDQQPEKHKEKEGEPITPTIEYITPPKWDELGKLSSAAEVTSDSLLKAAKVAKWEEIPAGKFEPLKARLTKKIEELRKDIGQ